MKVLELEETVHAIEPACGLSEGTVQAADEKDVDISDTALRLCPECFPDR